jgi:hypothetical protein
MVIAALAFLVLGMILVTARAFYVQGLRRGRELGSGHDAPAHKMGDVHGPDQSKGV